MMGVQPVTSNGSSSSSFHPCPEKDEDGKSSSHGEGVADMTVLSNLDEHGINNNVRLRYNRNKIYVSVHFFHNYILLCNIIFDS